jgi:predicted dehydrogenase
VPIELYGTEASLLVPDPNRFGGEIEVLRKGGEWTEVPTDMPYWDGNFRSIGLADMALALRQDRPHRANGALALHVLEVMEAFGRSADAGAAVDITTTVERPAPLSTSLVDGRLG